MLKVNRRDYPKHLYGNGMARPYREVGNRVVAGDVGMFKKSLSVLLVASLMMLSSAITSSEEKVDSFRRPVAGAASERLPALMASGCARPGPAKCNRLISGRPGRSRPHTFRFNLTE